MSTNERTVQLRTADGVLVLSVASGQLGSLEAVSRFDRELRQLARERGENRWLIDFGNTTFFIIPAINTLLMVLRTLRERGGRLIITGLSQDVRHLLGLTRVDRVLTICPTLSCGLTELGSPCKGSAEAAGAS